MTESFDGDWLDLREPHDAAARAPELASLLAASLPARPRILDLGAGTGSLLRWMGHFIGRAQAWTLVDADAALIERAFETIAERAEDAGWAATRPSRHTLLVHAPGGAWRVEGLVADLRDAPGNLPLHQADAVVNTALCDLVSEDWVARMAQACAARRLPFYTALNVTGAAAFLPRHPADALVARGFARDQGRDKGFGGRALGPRAPAAIAAAFAAQGFAVHRAASDWQVRTRPLTPETLRFAAELVAGHGSAAMRHEGRSASRIHDWVETRGEQAVAGRLAFRIGHADLLCLPPAKE